MPKYLFIFGYETPKQRVDNPRHGWDDEDSERVFIEAPDEQTALEWGAQIAERFIKELHDDPNISWIKDGFAHWIETEEPRRYINDVTIPTVAVGEFPDMSRWIHDAGGALGVESVVKENANTPTPADPITNEAPKQSRKRTWIILVLIGVFVGAALFQIVGYRREQVNLAKWNARVSTVLGPNSTPEDAHLWLIENGFDTIPISSSDPNGWMGGGKSIENGVSASYRVVMGEKKNDVEPYAKSCRFIRAYFNFNNDFTYRDAKVEPALELTLQAWRSRATTSAPAP